MEELLQVYIHRSDMPPWYTLHKLYGTPIPYIRRNSISASSYVEKRLHWVTFCQIKTRP